jgi:hypothetical protein
MTEGEGQARNALREDDSCTLKEAVSANSSWQDKPRHTEAVLAR